MMTSGLEVGPTYTLTVSKLSPHYYFCAIYSIMIPLAVHIAALSSLRAPLQAEQALLERRLAQTEKQGQALALALEEGRKGYSQRSFLAGQLKKTTQEAINNSFNSFMWRKVRETPCFLGLLGSGLLQVEHFH